MAFDGPGFLPAIAASLTNVFRAAPTTVSIVGGITTPGGPDWVRIAGITRATVTWQRVDAGAADGTDTLLLSVRLAVAGPGLGFAAGSVTLEEEIWRHNLPSDENYLSETFYVTGTAFRPLYQPDAGLAGVYNGCRVTVALSS